MALRPETRSGAGRSARNSGGGHRPRASGASLKRAPARDLSDTSRRRLWAATVTSAFLALASPGITSALPLESTIDGITGDTGDRSITFVGTVRDEADLAALGLGTAGFWFAQFGTPPPVSGAPTGENVREALPTWVAPFNHSTGPADLGCDLGAIAEGCLPTFVFRTFSQDGPARSAGGFPGWATIRLPSGELGLSGAIVDPQTFTPDSGPLPPFVVPPSGDPKPNNNNTINRIQLREGVPATFFVSVVTDSTAGEHDPGRLEIRGNAGLLDVPEEIADAQVEPTFPEPIDLFFDGVPDVYVFRIDGFLPGDYLKLRLRGKTSAASFAGLLFDLEDPSSSFD